MKNEKNITVIIPMYNSEKTIVRSLDSLFELNNQSKFKVLCIDDGSTDNSILEVYKYIKENNVDIKLLKKQNAGASSARNCGLEETDTEYVMFLDSDDCYSSGVIDTMLDQISYVDLCIMNVLVSSLRENIETPTFRNLKLFSNGELPLSLEELQLLGVFNSPTNKIYRMSIIKANNIKFDENLEVGEDFKFNLQYFRNIESCVLVPDIYLIYNISDSYLTTKYREDEFNKRKGNIELLKNYYEQTNIHKDLNYQYIKLFYAEIFQEFNSGKKYNFLEFKASHQRLLADKELANVIKTFEPTNLIEFITWFPLKNKMKMSSYLLAKSMYKVKHIKVLKRNTKSI